MASYLITGASRGIGLELTKQLLELPSSQVGKIFALTRGDPSGPLKELIEKSPDRAIHITAAIDNTESVQKAAREVEAQLGGQGLDVLVNNAGVTGFTQGGTKNLDPSQLAHIFDTNVIGVQRVISSFLPLLEAGKEKKVISISSTLGAVSWAHKFKLSPNPAYKISKSALHMLNAVYSLEYADAGFTFLLISPGWLKTDLGGDAADLPVEVGVAEVKRIILESTTAQNGKFLNIHVPGQENAWGQYDGKEITW